MTEEHYTLAMYLHLARASELRRRWMVRDKLLLVCAQRAQVLGLSELAEHCRVRILAHNSGHLVGHFASVADAVEDEQFTALVQQAERTYSAEKAEYMLQSLGIELGRAEATYATAEEYLGSILGPSPFTDAGAAPPETIAGDSQLTAETAPEPDVEIDVEWPAPERRRLTESELAARERLELRFLCIGLLGLTTSILIWGAYLLL